MNMNENVQETTDVVTATSDTAVAFHSVDEPITETQCTENNVNAEVVSEDNEPKQMIEDPDNPLNEISVKQIGQLLKQVGEMVQIMESQWNGSKVEFKLTDNHMKQLYQYNDEHRTEMPDGLTEEEQQKWDRFNGLDNITEEEALAIFGEGHPIIGIEHTITIDRIKDVVNDFFSWMSSVKEYRQIHDAYLELVELEEEKNIATLKEIAEKEEDPEKKSAMEKSIAMYYNRKHLEFLAEEMDITDRDRLVALFSDKKKIEYLLKRAQDKLSQLKISTKFILEISQFEKRFLPEKYHIASNILLLYFMQMVVYNDMSDANNDARNKAVCMVFALDGVIRKTWSEELREKIINNIMTMLDNIIEYLPNTEKTEVTE